MSDRQLEVLIKAVDQASATLKKIADEAARMGKVTESSGKQASAGLKQMDESAKRSAKSFDDVVDAASKVGIAVGTTVGVLGALGQSALNETRSIEALRRSYGSAADGIILYTEAIQDNTRFSNDQARQAAQTAATLVRNYGFTAAETKRVLAISADLAAVTGIDLVDATQRVTAALRGEAESAEVLGLTMNQAAIDKDNLTLSMSNEEAAHFRLNALYEQAAFAQGAAADQTEDLAGKTAQFINEIQDGTQALGAFLGPVGEVASQLSDYGFALAGAATGVKVLTDAYKALKVAEEGAAAAGGLGAVGGAAGAVGGLAAIGGALVTVGTAALIAAPAIAAVALAIHQAKAASEEYSATLSDTQEFLGEMGLQEDEQALALTRLVEMTRGVEVQTRESGQVVFQNLKDTQDEMLGLSEANFEYLMAFVDRIGGATQENAAAIGNEILLISRAQTELVGDEFQAFLKDLEYIGVATPEAIDELYRDIETRAARFHQQQLDQYEDFRILNKTWFDTPERPADAPLANTDYFLVQEERRQARLNEIYGVGTEEIKLQSGAVGDLGKDFHRLNDEQARQQSIFDHVIGSIYDTIDATKEAKQEAKDFIGMIADMGQGPTFLEGIISGLKGIGEPSFTPMIQALEQIGDVVDGVTTSVEQLDTAVSVVLGGTAALGKGVGELDNWATGITDASDGVSTLDQLLADHKITQEQYNQTLNDVGRIQRANLAIAEDQATIQVQQSQYMADQTADLAVYVDGLTKLPEAQQRIALGFLDQAEAVKLNDAVMLAATASQGGFTEAASATILTMAEQDTVFRDMALSVGLLRYEIDETGAKKLVVNFEGAEGLKSTLDDLTTSINLLTDAILGVPAGTTARLHVEGIEEVEAATAALAALQLKANVQLNNTYGIGGMASSYPAGPAPASAALPDTPPGGQPTTVQPAVPRIVPTGPTIPRPAATPTVRPLAAPELSVDQTLTITLEADPAPAVATIAETIADADGSTGTVTIDGTNDGAIESVTLAVAAANRARGTVAIAGNRSPFDNTVGSINGRIVGTAYINIQATGAAAGGLGESFALGGVVPHAMHGIVGDGRDFLVGEAGPEMVRLPGGSYVHTAPATKDKMRNGGGQGGGSGGDIYVANLAIYPSDGNVYDSIVSALRSNGR